MKNMDESSIDADKNTEDMSNVHVMINETRNSVVSNNSIQRGSRGYNMSPPRVQNQ